MSTDTINLTTEQLLALLSSKVTAGEISASQIKSYAKTLTAPARLIKSHANVVKLEGDILKSIDLEDLPGDHYSLQVIYVVDVDKTVKDNPVKVTLSTVSDKSCEAPDTAFYAVTDSKDRSVPVNKTRYPSRIGFIHTFKHERASSLVLSQVTADLRLFTEREGKVIPYVASDKTDNPSPAEVTPPVIVKKDDIK